MYAVIVNMAGYLPETEPIYVSDLDEARQALIAEIEHTYNCIDLDDSVDSIDFLNSCREIERGNMNEYELAGYVHSIEFGVDG